jgi:hypothetical protein
VTGANVSATSLAEARDALWNRVVRAFWVAFVLSSCGWSFTPPEHPPHDVEEGGVMHARRLETPFLCGSAARPERGEACPPARPPDDRASCDASGCHGTFDFGDPAQRRDLIGSDGPSCYTCHGREWED